MSANLQTEEWKSIHPQVSAEAEFFEIIHDFGNPLEILREAISNSVDWGATWIKITFSVGDFEGNQRLFIKIEDNGQGMTREVLETLPRLADASARRPYLWVVCGSKGVLVCAAGVLVLADGHHFHFSTRPDQLIT